MGFTEDGLSKLKEVLKGHVAKGSAPGLVAVVARGVETNLFSFGTMTLGGEVPVQRDTIFRIASMTKPINDPANGLTAILLTQRVFDSPDPPQVHKDFWKAAYAA